jgi:hypothetical protein
VTAGEPSRDLFNMAREGRRDKLRAAMTLPSTAPARASPSLSGW